MPENSQREQRGQHGQGAAGPALELGGQLFAFGEPVGADQDAVRQAASARRAAHGLGVFERAPMGFAQADDLGEPVLAQRAAGGVVQGHGQVRTRLPQRRGAAAGGAPL